MNIAPIFLFFQIDVCLRMKFCNIGAVGRLKIRKKKLPRKRSSIETVFRFDFSMHHELR